MVVLLPLTLPALLVDRWSNKLQWPSDATGEQWDWWPWNWLFSLSDASL